MIRPHSKDAPTRRPRVHRKKFLDQDLWENLAIMCGIAGMIDFRRETTDEELPEIAYRMASTVQHRTTVAVSAQATKSPLKV